MTDLSRAYGAVHAANRGDVSRLSNQFDSVRERLAYLRDHPDLSSLESTVLEVAAQMLHVSNELAEVYSNDRVTRPRDFLEQRQSELKHWLHEIKLEEPVAAAQLERLREELKDFLPELGIKTVVGADNTIVELTLKAAE
jgi:hypothetical protein